MEKVPQRKILKVLRDRFGFDELRETQDEVIQAVMRRENTLAILPTGAGKSLCFQLPALMIPGTTLVVSPLIALMKDQQEKLAQLEIEAFQLNSSLTKAEQNEGLDALEDGTADFIYTTPERLMNDEFMAQLKETEIDFVVIDEAHCITEWGHDFRPAYLGIRDAIKRIGNPPILALTATATPEVAEDIQKQLGLKNMTVIRAGVFRKNLQYEAHLSLTEAEKDQKLDEILSELEADPTSTGLVYASSVKSVESLYERFSARAGGVEKYHGRLSAKERAASQDRFMSGASRLMIATNAFGMGIDKANIRFVIHYNFPGSLESYYQETGRAGRDGQISRCILLYLKKDQRTQNFFLAGKHPKHEHLAAVFSALSEKAKPVKELQAACSAVPKSKVRVVLNTLRDAKLAQFTSQGVRLTAFGLSKPWNDAELLGVSEDFEQKRSADKEKLKAMIVYAQTSLCRWKALLKYFGESSGQSDCGSCDNCRAHARSKMRKEMSFELQSPVA